MLEEQELEAVPICFSTSVSIGISVIDRGNGAVFGINILSLEEEILQTGEKLSPSCRSTCNPIKGALMPIQY